MQLKVPDYFYDFKCIAGECEDTCCAGWEIVIDDEMHKTYKNVKGDFGKILNDNIVKSDDDNIFRLKDGNCFFLNGEKTCEIYKNLGEEYLCHTCSEFPRVTEEFLDKREVLLSLSCPEAARIILKEPRELKFLVEEIDEESIEDSNISEKVLKDYLDCRDLVLDLLNRKDIQFNKRIALTLKFVREVQDKIDLGDMDEIEEVIEDYKNQSIIDEILEELNKLSIDKEKNLDLIKGYIKVYIDLKHINSNDPLNLNKALEYLENNKIEYLNKEEEFNKELEENSYIFESLISYFVFRYFMKCIFDYDMAAKIKFSIISTLIIKELAKIDYLINSEIKKEDIINKSRIYSKDIEHSDQNVESLGESFETEEVFIDEKLESIILGLL